MSLRMYRTLQALILAGLGFGLLVKIIDGRVLLYIHQRFVVLALLAALALIALAQYALRARPGSEIEENPQPARYPSWGLWLTALPLLVGLLVPERPLGAAALETRGIYTSAGGRAFGGTADSAAIPAEQRTILDWVRIFGDDSDDSQTYAGQVADVSGFVARDLRLGADQFLVGRFTISCCVADASALGMVVEWPEAETLPASVWVRVRGPVRALELDGQTVPAIEAVTVEVIPEPVSPYLFP